MSELYQLPDGWEWKTIDEVCVKITDGAHKSPKTIEDGKPYITVRDVDGKGDINFINCKKISQVDYDLLVKGNCKPLKGDVLFSKDGTVGKVSLIDYKKDFVVLSSLAILRPSSEIQSKYLAQYLQSPFFYDRAIKSKTGAAIKRVVLRTIKNLDIPLPPLPEQKRIVSKLDTLFEKIDKAIALHQINMDEADLFMGSVLNEVFGELEEKYEKRTLESFNKKMSSGGTPSRKEKAYWDGTIEWFSSGELNQLYTLPSKERITQVGLDNTSAKLFSKGTLLIGMYDTAAMKMSILSNDGSCNQAIVGFRPKEDELNIFFAKYQLEYLKKEILEQRQGVRQQNLNLSKIKNVQIEYPPLTIQQKVVLYLDEISEKIEKVKTIQKEKMESLKALKASLLDRAFRGEL